MDGLSSVRLLSLQSVLVVPERNHELGKVEEAVAVRVVVHQEVVDEA